MIPDTTLRRLQIHVYAIYLLTSSLLHTHLLYYCVWSCILRHLNRISFCFRKNVCVTKEETDLGSQSEGESESNATSIFSGLRTRTETCAGGNGRYTCTAEVTGGGKHIRTTVRYECCHGFRLQAQRCVQGALIF